jgi:hypothetical protein
MLAEWLPHDEATGYAAVFSNCYKMLLKEGVQFPPTGEFVFFSEERITAMEEEVQRCAEEAERMREESEGEYFEGRGKFDAANMNGVEYLQRKLKEKERIISDMKYNTSMSEFQKQSVVEKLKEQENHHANRIETYEMKIAALTKEVREMREIMNLQGAKPTKRENENR